jgi:hypothetical protein
VQAYGLFTNENVNWMDTFKRSYRDLGRIYFKEPLKAGTFATQTLRAKEGEEAHTEPAAATVKQGAICSPSSVPSLIGIEWMGGGEP